jgi:hypothetical protein
MHQLYTPVVYNSVGYSGSMMKRPSILLGIFSQFSRIRLRAIAVVKITGLGCTLIFLLKEAAADPAAL